LGKPVPKATPAAIAQNKKEQESRSTLSTYNKMMLNFKKGPDVSQATKVGEPTLVDPKQTSAPELVRAASANVMSALTAATTGTATAGTGTAPPAENAAAPRSDAGTAATGTTSPGATASAGAEIVGQPSAPAPASGIDELGNDLKPPAGTPAADGTAPPLPPTQVNDAPKAAAPESTTATADAGSQQAAAADTNTESSSKKKKKKHLLVF
jgi:hypothetical protein